MSVGERNCEKPLQDDEMELLFEWGVEHIEKTRGITRGMTRKRTWNREKENRDSEWNTEKKFRCSKRAVAFSGGKEC
jgi:hypothetical protein